VECFSLEVFEGLLLVLIGQEGRGEDRGLGFVATVLSKGDEDGRMVGEVPDGGQDANRASIV
jgi:hypothetical protein